MPTYDYECTNCQEIIEITRPADSDQHYDCPVCEFALRRVYRATPIHFKGDGFYSTS